MVDHRASESMTTRRHAIRSPLRSATLRLSATSPTRARLKRPSPRSAIITVYFAAQSTFAEDSDAHDSAPFNRNSALLTAAGLTPSARASALMCG